MTGTEVEIKAVVLHPRELALRLRRLGTFIRPFTKVDRYFGFARELPETRFRLRRDGESWICTRKNKILRDSIEESREEEFSVSDGELFEQFVREAGFQLLFEKEKVGERWEVDGTTVEVSRVNDLGTYVEVELILDDDASLPARDDARNRVRTVLDRLGVPESAVEERTYTQMIYENLSRIKTSPSRSL
ncbi:MAG: class IV adenylate cyclase [Spirochaetaceae bacterium]|nr:MAG: class IV adenylate cyclase [Spirochaetaceae bacterium]